MQLPVLRNAQLPPTPPGPPPSRPRARPLSFMPELLYGVSRCADLSRPAQVSLQPTAPLQVSVKPLPPKLWIPTPVQPSWSPPSPASLSRISSIRRTRRTSSPRPRLPSRRQSASTSSSLQATPASSRPSSQLLPQFKELPPEVWHQILRLATLIPRLDPAECSDFVAPPTEPLTVRRIKRAIVRVCTQWRALGTPMLYECIAVEKAREAAALLELFGKKPTYGRFVRRIAFAVVGTRYDVRNQMVLVRKLVDMVPLAAAVHVVFLSGGRAASMLPETLSSSGDGLVRTSWSWRALDWMDPSANDPRSFERLLVQCPHLEQLNISGNAVCSSSPQPSTPPAGRRSRSLVLPLKRLTLRDATPTTIALISRWSLPHLTHLSLSLGPHVSHQSVAALFVAYGPRLKFLRLVAPHLPSEVVTALVALCPNVEQAIIPIGATLPPLARLRKLGFVRAAGVASLTMDVLEAIDVRATLPALRTVAVVEGARYELSARDIVLFRRSVGRRVVFLDVDGFEVSFS